MNIHESGENYLESVLMLQERLGKVRSIDVVGELGYSKPSVSVAMKKLRESGYILVDDEGYISLTPAGMDIAGRIYDRHRTISRFLVGLGVGESVAAEDACKIEHDISEETFEKIRALVLERENS